MLTGKELVERVNNLSKEDVCASTYFTKEGYEEGKSEISFKLHKYENYGIDVFGYYSNKYLGINEDIVPVGTSEEEVNNRILELEELSKELSENISKEVKELEELLEEKIASLKKKAILKYILKEQLKPLKETQSIQEFDIRSNSVENKNKWIDEEYDVHSIQNEVFTFRYRVKNHWSYNRDISKVDIIYSLYVNVKGQKYVIADVEVVKLESEKDNYIEKLKSRFAKYFKYEEPTIDEKTIEKLTQCKDFVDYSFEELKNRLITMKYNVVKKL